MTSHQNHGATEAFFAEHRYFELDRERVHFFRQGRMPAVNFEGKIMLEAPGIPAPRDRCAADVSPWIDLPARVGSALER